MSRKETAYAVLLIDTSKHPATVIGAGIFGEPDPTTMGRVAKAVLFEVSADSFVDAVRAAGDVLADQRYEWVGELVTGSIRGAYRAAWLGGVS